MKKKTGNNKIRTIVLSIILILLCPFNNQAQDEILKREITTEFNNIKLNDAFRIIEKKLSIYFTFEGSLINTDKIIKHTFNSTPLENCLNLILNDSSLAYKVIDNHVIIRKRQILESGEETPVELPKVISVRGRIIDKISKEPLPYTSIFVSGYSYGVVSNNNGEFILKIPPSLKAAQLCITHLGYSNMCFSVSDLIDDYRTFRLERNYISIQEVLIRKTDAKNIIRNSIKNIKNNYSTDPVCLTGFYRESVKKSNKYMFFSEAVMQIYKSSYLRSTDMDMLKILKSRKMQDLSMEDTVVVKLKSGLNATLELDLVKNPIAFLDEANFDSYWYNMTDIVRINERDAYQIEFGPKEFAEDAVFEGKIFIDIQNLAILSCEFLVNPKRMTQNQNQYIVKKKRGIKLKISTIAYNISYRQIGNKYYFNHVTGDLNMKVKKHGKLFSFNFDISFEMAVSEVDTLNVEKFSRKEAARLHTIFFDEISQYDEEFWGQYNFIKPDRPLQEAIEKIKHESTPKT